MNVRKYTGNLPPHPNGEVNGQCTSISIEVKAEEIGAQSKTTDLTAQKSLDITVFIAFKVKVRIPEATKASAATISV